MQSLVQFFVFAMLPYLVITNIVPDPVQLDSTQQESACCEDMEDMDDIAAKPVEDANQT